MAHVLKRNYMKRATVAYKVRGVTLLEGRAHKRRQQDMSMRDDLLAYYYDKLNH